MSTEHQKYSTENQSEIIQRYAKDRGIEIVRTYADHGKSGLRLDGRDALKRLIDDVRAGRADYSAVLVYDVLEHSVDPWELLGRLHVVAAAAARLHVSVPNARHWTRVLVTEVPPLVLKRSTTAL